MTGNFMLILIPVIGGVAVVLQAHLMSIIDQGLGTLESVFINYVGGAVLVALIMLFLRGGNLAAWHNVPWYSSIAGACGLVIVGSVCYTVPRIGFVPSFTVLVATQFVIGALFDHFGLLGAEVRPLELSRIMGIGVLLTGVWLTMR